MLSTCLSVCRQGWIGVPIFLLGIVSLAFSQLVQDAEIESLPPDQQVQFIDSKLKDLNNRLSTVTRNQSGDQFRSKKDSAIGNLNQLVSVYGKNDSNSLSVQTMLDNANQSWQIRRQEIGKGVSSVDGRLREASMIFDDLRENFAGRLEEASPALVVIQENLVRTEDEVDTLSRLSDNAVSEAIRDYSNVQAESDRLAIQAVPILPVASSVAQYSSTGRQVANAITSKEAVALGGSSRFAPSISTNAGTVEGSRRDSSSMETADVINRLKSELAVSKSVQTELSADTTDLQGDLRKAYREIVSLQNNLKESQMIVEELEETKNSLWQTGNGQNPTAQSVSGKIRRLENELQLAREDLRASRQTLLLEKERSNAMIRSVTNELDRTRRDLDAARTATVSSGADSIRLASLERELNEARRSLQMVKMAPMDSTQETYLTLQNELKKALGEITKMQIELSDRDELEAQLVKLRNSMENMGENTNRAQSSEYVNTLLIDLNSAKREVEKAKSANRQEAMDLIEKVASLENDLKISKLELKKTNFEFKDTKQKIAMREFEYATTIQQLEEDAQMAQNSLVEASLGKLPAIPFVDEMERNLAESEARIKDLSDRFESEQGKATELIDGLQVELNSAILRQKAAIEQLARREIDLESKDSELTRSKEESRKLKEELAVVKVIAGQLEDLNNVLEDTKKSQSSQSGSMGQVVDSLREELNQAKVELVFTIEEREKIQSDSSKRINALELQLEDTRNQLLAEQQGLSDYSNDSKELVLDLKSELDATRSEIARMKSVGLGESVETTQAVSQLQEALGTIRILQESLDESEKVNLEVDNLRIELANAMESQLNELQNLEEEKSVLRQETIDLESEIALLREQGLGTGIQFQKSNTSLQEQLKVSQANIAELERRTASSEDNDVLSLIELEEELEKEKLQNQELRDQLSKASLVKNKTVELLEEELANALQKLDALEGNQKMRDTNLSMLEKEFENTKQLMDSSAQSTEGDGREQFEIISRLENQLLLAQSKLANLENRAFRSSDNQEGAQAFQELETELENAEGTVISLQAALKSRELKSSQFENKLKNALSAMESKESDNAFTSFIAEEIDTLENKLQVAENKLIARDASDPEDVLRLEDELSAAQKTIEDLLGKTQFEEAARIEMEGQLTAALNKLDTMSELRTSFNKEEKTNSDDVVNKLQTLLDKKDLKLGLLETELANAISEMTEKEAELEMVGSIKDEMLVLENQLREAEKNIKRSQNSSDFPIQNQALSNPEVKVLQNEIDQLKIKLAQAKAEPKIGISNEDMMRLQDQLQLAVAESVEMQTELEVTKARLIQLEASNPSIMQQPKLQKLLSDAENAEFQAETRIANLTQSLRNSEGLRKQMEELISEIQNNAENKAKDYSEDPRFLEMQKELMLLQDDLLAVRNIDNPKIEALQNELFASQNDSSRLNEEFKGAMADFVKIKEQMALLENENDRLEKEILGNSNNQNKGMVSNLKNQLSEVQGEFANLREQLADKDKRVSNLRESLAQAQLSVPGISPDNAALRSKVVRLEGMLDSAQDVESRAKAQADSSFRKAQALSQEVAILKDQLRQSESVSRGLPSRIDPLASPRQVIIASNNNDQIEIARLKEQVQQLKLAQTIPQRNQFDRKIRDLNQKNLTAQIQLDQERSRVEDFKRQLADALEIKQGVLQRGQSANLKASLLNEELESAKNRITSLERTLIAARDAIRVLKKDPSSSSMKVSVPRSSRFNPTTSLSSNRPVVPLTGSLSSPRQYSSRNGTSSRSPGDRNSFIPQSSFSSPGIQQIPKGNASLQLRAQVQFLNNKNRPAGFTEFFLLRDDLESIIKTAGIRIPPGQGIDSGSELWARSVQRGYRYPGVASAIRNALATKSLARIKTNSIGESNLENIEPGNYFVVGSSPLGQVGVIWSEEVQLRPGTNGLTLDLRDAVWAE